MISHDNQDRIHPFCCFSVLLNKSYYGSESVWDILAVFCTTRIWWGNFNIERLAIMLYIIVQDQLLIATDTLAREQFLFFWTMLDVVELSCG